MSMIGGFSVQAATLYANDRSRRARASALRPDPITQAFLDGLAERRRSKR